jgi:hypothetical protein
MSSELGLSNSRTHFPVVYGDNPLGNQDEGVEFIEGKKMDPDFVGSGSSHLSHCKLWQKPTISGKISGQEGRKLKELYGKRNVIVADRTDATAI